MGSVPRNRTVRLAVLGSSVQRAASSGYSTNRSSALKRRIVAGSRDGVALLDVVVTADGLVGQVTKVFANVSRVALLTDEDSAVRATDGTSPAAVGVLQPGRSGGDSLILTRVSKDKVVRKG